MQAGVIARVNAGVLAVPRTGVPVPAGLPSLAAGRHLDPAEGGCLMEYVSLLAGQRWSDRPACTHPALAELARLVNDASSPAGRAALAPLAPTLVGVRGRDPRVAPTLVLLAAADRASVAARWAARRLSAARRGGLAGWCCALTDPLYRAGPGRAALARAVTRLATAPQNEADRRLHGLLQDAIAVTVDLLAARSGREIRSQPGEVPEAPALAGAGGRAGQHER